VTPIVATKKKELKVMNYDVLEKTTRMNSFEI
jgi:hypothetical protein